jgi:hypothetical protein
LRGDQIQERDGASGGDDVERALRRWLIEKNGTKGVKLARERRSNRLFLVNPKKPKSQAALKIKFQNLFWTRKLGGGGTVPCNK